MQTRKRYANEFMQSSWHIYFIRLFFSQTINSVEDGVKVIR